MRTTTLRNQQTQKMLIENLEVADTLWSAGKGLLGRSRLSENQALWILNCNNIHTFFMRFPIDCVFLDKTLKVHRIYPQVKAWRLIWPVWGASSVVEMASGMAEKLNIRVGDQLHVGT